MLLIIHQMAAASTKRYAEGNPLSFVDGIPVAVKEEFNVVRQLLSCDCDTVCSI